MMTIVATSGSSAVTVDMQVMGSVACRSGLYLAPSLSAYGVLYRCCGRICRKSLVSAVAGSAVIHRSA